MPRPLRRLLLLPFKQWCLFVSEVGYSICSFFDPKADYRICIVMAFYNKGDKGHAWLIRNGRSFLLRSLPRDLLEPIGHNGKYEYFVERGNLERFSREDR